MVARLPYRAIGPGAAAFTAGKPTAREYIRGQEENQQPGDTQQSS
jgi:hypothetical protein